MRELFKTSNIEYNLRNKNTLDIPKIIVFLSFQMKSFLTLLLAIETLWFGGACPPGPPQSVPVHIFSISKIPVINKHTKAAKVYWVIPGIARIKARTRVSLSSRYACSSLLFRITALREIIEVVLKANDTPCYDNRVNAKMWIVPLLVECLLLEHLHLVKLYFPPRLKHFWILLRLHIHRHVSSSNSFPYGQFLLETLHWHVHLFLLQLKSYVEIWGYTAF